MFYCILWGWSEKGDGRAVNSWYHRPPRSSNTFPNDRLKTQVSQSFWLWLKRSRGDFHEIKAWGGRSLRTRINVLQPLCSLCFCDCSVLKGPPLAKGTQQKASANLSTPVTTQHPPPYRPQSLKQNHFKVGLWGAETKSSLWFCLSLFWFFFSVSRCVFLKAVILLTWISVFSASLSVICWSVTHIAAQDPRSSSHPSPRRVHFIRACLSTVVTISLKESCMNTTM